MARRVSRQSLAASAAALALAGVLLAAGLTPEQQAIVSHISADSLRGHLSFIASDLLEGRAIRRAGWTWLLNISPLSSAALAWSRSAIMITFKPPCSKKGRSRTASPVM